MGERLENCSAGEIELVESALVYGPEIVSDGGHADELHRQGISLEQGSGGRIHALGRCGHADGDSEKENEYERLFHG